ncbi:hypothetical protein ACQP2T_63635 (plasmid) [Nonomuraea sp. CA-143628]|uniref:hypothetical protein n=1 Tax=Nonomuraea sp. CA-143628 TaxID=3239997 RepID=UPI003D8EFF50
MGHLSMAIGVVDQPGVTRCPPNGAGQPPESTFGIPVGVFSCARLLFAIVSDHGSAITSDMQKRPSPAETWAARMSSTPPITEGTRPTMTHAAFSNTLSESELDLIQATADVWRLRGYGQTADNLLAVAGLTLPTPEPSVLPPNVYQLSAYRARSQAAAR